MVYQPLKSDRPCRKHRYDDTAFKDNNDSEEIKNIVQYGSTKYYTVVILYEVGI